MIISHIKTHTKQIGYISLALLAFFVFFLSFKTKPNMSQKPNVMIIVMDTVRQDRLSCYGYSRNTSPTLDKLAKKSRIYSNAYSTSSWTSPAHASLFTGLYPVAHKTTQENWKMSPKLVTLAEIYKKNGYETLGITENSMLSKYNNFHQGFSHYYETWKEKKKYKKKKVKNITYPLLKKFWKHRNRKKPFFVFVNFIEPHSPYNSSEQFYDTFLTNKNIKIESDQWAKYFLKEVSFSDNELQHLRELYDAEILYTDYLIGKIIADLKKNGLWKNTIFIVTSDHGENIGDHDMMDHVFSLYETLIKVPLIIHYPKMFQPGSQDHKVVQLVDIFPTLLRLTGINANTYPSQGFDLLDKNSRKNRPVFCEYYYPIQALNVYKAADRNNPSLTKYKRRIRSFSDGQYKLIWGSGNVFHLYDLTKDPEEKNDLSNKKKFRTIKQKLFKKMGELRNSLKITTIAPAKPSTKEKDKLTKESLKSLGYLQ